MKKLWLLFAAIGIAFSAFGSETCVNRDNAPRVENTAHNWALNQSNSAKQEKKPSYIRGSGRSGGTDSVNQINGN